MDPESTENPVDPYEERVQRALQADIPLIYANGFVSRMSQGDIMMIMERNAEPVAVINLSYTVTKSLIVSLGQLISKLEEISGREIMTTRDIEEFVSRKTSGGQH